MDSSPDRAGEVRRRDRDARAGRVSKKTVRSVDCTITELLSCSAAHARRWSLSLELQDQGCIVYQINVSRAENELLA
jgi:hypothetical protein